MVHIKGRSAAVADDRGMALPTALLVLVILTLLGTAAVFTSSTELDIAGNGRRELQALSVAEAGIHEALARLNMKEGTSPTRIVPDVDGSGNPVATWTTTIVKGTPGANQRRTLTYSTTDPTAELPIFTTIRYKREATEQPISHCNADGCSNQEVVRFHTDYQYSGSHVPTGTQVGPPVLQLSSIYADSSASSSKTLLVEAVRSITNIQTPGTVRACGQVRCSGTGDIDGTAHPDQSAIVAGQSGGTGCNDSRVDPDPSTNPNAVQVQACPLSPADLFQQTFGVTREYMKQIADIVAPAPFAAPPSGTRGKIIYVTGTAKSTWQGNNVLGSPTEPVIVVFEGDFRVQGNLTFYGVVYVVGNMEFGGGTQNYYGAIISQGSAEINLSGNTFFTYNPDVLDNLKDLSPFTTILWKVN